MIEGVATAVGALGSAEHFGQRARERVEADRRVGAEFEDRHDLALAARITPGLSLTAAGADAAAVK